MATSMAPCVQRLVNGRPTYSSISSTSVRISSQAAPASAAPSCRSVRSLGRAGGRRHGLVHVSSGYDTLGTSRLLGASGFGFTQEPDYGVPAQKVYSNVPIVSVWVKKIHCRRRKFVACVLTGVMPPPTEELTDHFYTWKEGYQCHYVRMQSKDAPNDKATPVVFLPGFGVSTFHFQNVMKELQALDSSPVYAIDWFGQGKSWPTADPAPSKTPSTEEGFEWGFGSEAVSPYTDLVYSLNTWTEQLEYFLETQMVEAHGVQKTVLAGNSLGGFIAANLASKRPDLVEGLVFLNATPFWGANRDNFPIWKGTLPIPNVIQKIAALWWNSIRTTETITTMLDFVYVTKEWDKSIIAEIQEPTRHPASAAAFCSILFAPPPADNFDTMLAKIKANNTPVCLCYGKDDPWVVPAWGQKAKRELGDSCLYYEVTPSGHCPHHETPAPVAFTVHHFSKALENRTDGEAPTMLSLENNQKHFDGEVMLSYLPKGSPRNIFEKFSYGVYCIEKYVLRSRE